MTNQELCSNLDSDTTSPRPQIFSRQIGGDVDWWVYGANFLRHTLDSAYQLEYEYLVHIEGIEGSHPDSDGEIDEYDPTLTVEVYRYSVPDSKEKLFEDLNWVNWNSVYQCMDINLAEIGDDSTDYVQLAIAAFEYYGWSNADSHPQWLTQSAIKQFLNLED